MADTKQGAKPQADKEKEGADIKAQEGKVEVTLESLKEAVGIDVQGLSVEEVNAAIQAAVDGPEELTPELLKEKTGIDLQGLDSAEAVNEAIAQYLAGPPETKEAKEPSAAEKEKAAKAEADKLTKERAERKAAAKKAAAAVRDKEFEFNGLNYRFAKHCPDSLNIDGKPLTLDKIFEDKAIMAELISGNSNFIEQIYS